MDQPAPAPREVPAFESPKSIQSKWPPILGGIVVVVVIILAVIFYFRPGPSNNSQSTSTATTTVSGGINYNTHAMEVAIKTIPIEAAYNLTIYNIGTLTGAPYQGDTLALAVVNTGNNPNGEIYTYLYYVADKLGNPIAWDPALMHTPQTFMQVVDGGPDFRAALGLTDNLKQTIVGLPPELYWYAEGSASGKYDVTTTKQGAFDRYDYLVVPKDTGAQAITTSEEGWPITKVSNPANIGPLQTSSDYNYYAALPFGASFAVHPQPDFVNADDRPNLTWSQGSKDMAVYRYGQVAYGWQDCFAGFTNEEIEASLIQTGATASGAPVYEVNPVGHDKIYQCFFTKTKRYVYDPATQKGTYEDTTTYDKFIQSHPVFFWKHPIGDMIIFVRSDVVPAAERAKPVIYLYPTKPTQVSVKVNPVGGLTKSVPAYTNGWVVEATPSGLLTNLTDNKTYPYLFWEGQSNDQPLVLERGFVVTKANVAKLLGEKLSLLGLNDQERKDFIEFWTPKLSSAPYYFITFVSQDKINQGAPLTINPKPDTIIRVLMDYKPLNEPINVLPQTLTPITRSGFTVVEWGGIVRN